MVPPPLQRWEQVKARQLRLPVLDMYASSNETARGVDANKQLVRGAGSGLVILEVPVLKFF